jgi:hypothetical protein
MVYANVKISLCFVNLRIGFEGEADGIFKA